MLMIERIVKGSDKDVKSEDLSELEKSKVEEMKETVEKIKSSKSSKKISVELLRTWLDQMKQVAKKPFALVKMSVHGRIIARGDEGEMKPLKDGRMNRPTGEYNNYKDHHGRGRGGRAGRSGFQTGVAHPGDRMGRNQHNENGGFDKRPVDETTKKLHEDLSTNAAANIQAAKASKNDLQRVRLILNQITQDNVEVKISQLREMLIGDRKLLSEPGFKQEEVQGF